MVPASQTLNELRSEIDAIDAALHDLVMRRTALVEQIGAVKPPGRPALRPAREAEILRNLMDRHQGAFPPAALSRMWREMIAALTRLQGPFAVAVYAPDDHRGFWDLARDHYGSATPMQAANSSLAVLRLVAEGSATVGVLPWPEDDDPDPWWRYLFTADAKSPRIIARLPFLARAGREEVEAMAIAALPLEETGDDRTLLGIELREDMSRGRLKDSLEAAGLPPLQLRTFHLPGGAGSVHLTEVEAFVGPDDPRLVALYQRLGEALVRLLPIGTYATPIGLARRG
ncbi:chorismate mutase [Rhodocista pekingensis]|uniref:chorismate mutase n=1 Tax=Rhodocista pekingensis TaxID=201185 RepID=A0ABW2L1U6_9PROT